ncbi:MAG: helix-turn-helix domain-containing protein [Waterburya sp.]
MDIVYRKPALDLPQKIKQARIKDGRSVQLLATMAGISSAYWYQLETDKREWVSVEIIKKIEEVLGVDLGANFKQPIAA